MHILEERTGLQKKRSLKAWNASDRETSKLDKRTTAGLVRSPVRSLPPDGARGRYALMHAPCRAGKPWPQAQAQGGHVVELPELVLQ